MQLTLALLAIGISVPLLAWIGLRDAKRLRAQEADSPSRQPVTSRARRVVALASVAPGVLLLASGWWSSAVMWLGGTVTLVWLWVLWLARPRGAGAGAGATSSMTRGERLRGNG